MAALPLLALGAERDVVAVDVGDGAGNPAVGADGVDLPELSQPHIRLQIGDPAAGIGDDPLRQARRLVRRLVLIDEMLDQLPPRLGEDQIPEQTVGERGGALADLRRQPGKPYRERLAHCSSSVISSMDRLSRLSPWKGTLDPGYAALKHLALDQ